eukprot:gnl/Hemi2/16271_TR5407_c0_g1_i1.p1 gnl/Hemi2/16271_TR5407_c0_g1~~gnl/Hemi2/16271_TR5407_c0_g1_i1.p1  ORF type:complete len:274 (+),score=53.95 gnl/Hemi2/16271_TR5407_c0_g1_i1:118-939(+)
MTSLKSAGAKRADFVDSSSKEAKEGGLGRGALSRTLPPRPAVPSSGKAHAAAARVSHTANAGPRITASRVAKREERWNVSMQNHLSRNQSRLYEDPVHPHLPAFSMSSMPGRRIRLERPSLAKDLVYHPPEHLYFGHSPGFVMSVMTGRAKGGLFGQAEEKPKTLMKRARTAPSALGTRARTRGSALQVTEESTTKDPCYDQVMKRTRGVFISPVGRFRQEASLTKNLSYPEANPFVVKPKVPVLDFNKFQPRWQYDKEDLTNPTTHIKKRRH